MVAVLAFFSSIWGFAKAVPTYLKLGIQVFQAYAQIKGWIKGAQDRANQKKQDELIDVRQDEAKKAVETGDQRDLEKVITGEEGGKPAEIRDGVEERSSSEREARRGT